MKPPPATEQPEQQPNSGTDIRQEEGETTMTMINSSISISKETEEEFAAVSLNEALDNNKPSLSSSISLILEEEQEPNAKAVKADTPLPWGPLLIVLFIFLADSFNQTTLGPYISDMIIHMGLVPDGDKRKVGRYSGLLATCYYVAQFFSAYFWGMASDRYGRRPILLCGIIGASISSLMFGLSSSFWWALMSRSLYGILNGNLGVYKTYLAEISDKSNQARVFTYMAVTFSVGSIIGPLLSGLTSDPLKQYAVLSRVLPQFLISLLTKFPFLLPNFIMSLMSIVSFFFGLYYLKETNQRVLSRRVQQQQQQQEKEQEEDDLELQEEGETTNKQIEQEEENIDEEQESLPNSTLKTVVVDHGEGDNGEEGEDVDGADDKTDDLSLFKQKEKKSLSTVMTKPKYVRWFGTVKQKLKFENEIFQSYAPLATVALYAVYGFVGTVFNELMPLWLVLKVEDGGLGFVQRQIGIMNAVSFVFLLLWSLIFVPRIIKRFGCLITIRSAIILGAAPIALTPAVNFVASYRILTWACLIFVYVWRHSAFQAVFASLTIMSNNSVSPLNMGQLNGISQSSVALTRAIGPVVGTSLFSLLLSVGVFPLNVYFMYFVLTGLFLSLLLVTIRLPKTIDTPKEELK